MTIYREGDPTNDTHDWDGVPDMPKWHDVYTPEELAAALDVQAAKLAKKHGYTEIAAELGHAAECILDLAERCEQGAKKAEQLGRIVDETQRLARASLESLSRLP